MSILQSIFQNPLVLGPRQKPTLIIYLDKKMSNKTLYKKRVGIILCYPFEEKRLLKWGPPYIIQPKLDGVRCRAVKLPNDNFLLLSSEENIIYSVPHINEELNKLNLPFDELDGELYCHRMSFEQIVSRTSRTVNLHPDYKSIQYHIFDCVNEEPQINRTLAIKSLIGLSPHLKIVPFYLCNNLSEVMKTYDKILSLNYEGIIARHLNAPYVRKRSIYLMKFKPKKSDEYKIVGYNEEISITGEPKNSLGSVLCTGSDGCIFKVGSGFTKQDREEYWKVKEELIGKICKVSYQHLTDKKVPRFPVFCKIID